MVFDSHQNSLSHEFLSCSCMLIDAQATALQYSTMRTGVGMHKYFFAFTSSVFFVSALPALAMDTAQMSMAMAASAGKAKVCGFSESTARKAFGNIGLLLRCAVNDGEYTESQADTIMLRAAELYGDSVKETANPGREVCDNMKNLVEQFAKIEGC